MVLHPSRAFITQLLGFCTSLLVQISPAAGNQALTVTPSYQEVRVGGVATVMCRVNNGLPISECSFKMVAADAVTEKAVTWTPSNVETVWRPSYNSNGTAYHGRYAGRGLAHGECGVALSGLVTLHLIGCRVVQGLAVHLGFASVHGLTSPTLHLAVKPDFQRVDAGSDVSILCRHEGSAPLDKCVFKLPSNAWVRFNEGHDSHSTNHYHYHGRGLKRGHCGIHLTNVTSADSGRYICITSTGSLLHRNASSGYRISVLFVSGAETTLEVAVNQTEFEVGEPLVATCKVTGPHPLPAIAWRLGDKILPANASVLKESRLSWIWEEQSSTLELNTDVGIRFTELPLRCDFLKDADCKGNLVPRSGDVGGDNVKMIRVKPNCGTRITVEYDSSKSCEDPDIIRNDAEFIDDTIDQPADHSPRRRLKKKFEGFPWHAGIYQFLKMSAGPAGDGKVHRLFKQICGGTLITKRHVLTAAHCFGDTPARRLNSGARFKVTMGKWYRDYDQFDCRVQWREVGMKQVHVYPRYVGFTHSFKYDLAVIDLGKPVILTTRVGLACVDWDNQYQDQLLAAGKLGWLSGWGYLSQTGEQSDILRTLALPYMDTEKCLGHLDHEVKHLLTSDKFCAGYRNRNMSACPGDSGGGLLFEHATLGVYYVNGVVSTSFKPAHFRGKCFNNEVTAFTAVAEFLPWVKATVQAANVTYFNTLFYKHVARRTDLGARKVARVLPMIRQLGKA